MFRQTGILNSIYTSVSSDRLEEPKIELGTLALIFHSTPGSGKSITSYQNMTLIFDLLLKKNLSYDVTSASEITPCNKIDKPLVVYRFTGNVMTSITTLRTL